MHRDGEPGAERIMPAGRAEEAAWMAATALEVIRDRNALGVARRVMDAMPVMVAVVDVDLEYQYANQTYVDMVNSKHSTWEGKTVAEYLPEYLQEQIRPKVTRARIGERTKFYVDIVPADGLQRTFLVNYEPLCAPDGRPEMFMMTGLDATDLKMALQRLEATQKLETIAQLTGGIAHDVNNQLAVMEGSLTLLEHTTSSSDQQRLIERCRRAVAGCTRLTSQLLTYGGRQALRPSAMRVSEHLQPIMELARVGLPDNVALEVDMGGDEHSIRVDPTQMENAILNLIFNARDGLPHGGTIRVEVSAAGEESEVVAKSADREGDFVCIEVIDDGPGMDADTARHAFEPYFTTKPPGQGTGMGLATVYGFVKQSGGHIELITAPARGATVRIFLPKVEHAERHQRNVTLTAPSRSRRLLILVVEDEPSVCEVICEQLRYLGHLTRSCDSAELAMQMLAAEHFDVVLTDVQIKGPLNGWQLRDLVRAEFPAVQVLCTSGYPNVPASHRAGLGVEADFLPKPITFDALASALGQAQEVAAERSSGES